MCIINWYHPLHLQKNKQPHITSKIAYVTVQKTNATRYHAEHLTVVRHCEPNLTHTRRVLKNRACPILLISVTIRQVAPSISARLPRLLSRLRGRIPPDTPTETQWSLLCYASIMVLIYLEPLPRLPKSNTILPQIDG